MRGGRGAPVTDGARHLALRDRFVTFGGSVADDLVVVWLWVVGGVLAWLFVALLVASVLGRGIRLADSRRADAARSLSTADLEAPATAETPVVAARTRRRAIPLPPVGVALAALAVALETAGYVTRLNGVHGLSARLLSMDAPLSLPRMFVAFLFAVGAVAAVAGAGRLPGRRAWWLAVGLVAGSISAIKAGGTLHVDAMNAVEQAYGDTAAQLLSVAVAAVVIGVLWTFSRDDRRDRRRVLGTLALYAFAAIGLSAVSGAVPENWAAVATFIEESGEALAGVAFLIGVLVGVAPRLVLPAEWALRRELDAQTLDLHDVLPGRTGEHGTARG